MDSVLEGLDDENEDIRLAAVRCLHSLSRSVQQLRTTFQDHSVWRPLMALLTGMCLQIVFLTFRYGFNAYIALQYRKRGFGFFLSC